MLRLPALWEDSNVMRYVYAFDEPCDGGRELLGGKGIGLAEMTALGVPVPAGFTITTEACRAYRAGGRLLPDGLEGEIDEHVRRLEEQTDKRFGDAADPLLVSVRSGASVSMPGMMDTILNVGLGDEAVAGLAASTGNPRFAHDSYRRLIQMYGETVDGVDPHRFEQELQSLKAARGAAQDVELTADDLAGLVETFKGIYEQETGWPFPQDARMQLTRAVNAVFDSWETPRAQVYRRAHDIPDDLGTAVNVVQMVFGNKGERSATGVAFTRNPSTGEPGAFGEFLVDAQGEDVVAGIRTPEPLALMESRLPRVVRRAARHDAAARGALPRRPGHRVHDRGGPPLPAADADGETDGRGGAEGGRRHGLRGADHARRGGRAHRPGPARSAPPPDDRPGRRGRGDRDGAQRLTRRGVREGGLRRWRR